MLRVEFEFLCSPCTSKTTFLPSELPAATHCQRSRASASHPEPFRLCLSSHSWTVYALDHGVCGEHKMGTARFNVSHPDVFRHCKAPRQTPRGLYHTHFLGGLACISSFSATFLCRTHASFSLSLCHNNPSNTDSVKVNFPPMCQHEQSCS